jgi:hypothetical protein
MHGIIRNVKKPSRPRPADRFRFARHGAPIGMWACFEDGGRAGRITDVILEDASGATLAFEVLTADGQKRFLPADALLGQQGDQLRFAGSARTAPRRLCDLAWLRQDDGAPEDHEFAVLETFEPDMQDRT